MIEFKWDPKKNKSNQNKHGVSFEEAKSVFFDEYAVQFFDEPHADKATKTKSQFYHR